MITGWRVKEVYMWPGCSKRTAISTSLYVYNIARQSEPSVRLWCYNVLNALYVGIDSKTQYSFHCVYWVYFDVELTSTMKEVIPLIY